MQTSLITTLDNTELFVRQWLLAKDSEKHGSVVIIHGLGEHSGRYQEVAKVLNSIGLEVCSYDLRGHGKSQGKRGSIPNRDAFYNDAKIVFENFAKGKKEKPFLLGHSMGGGLAAGLVVNKIIIPRGLVMSSPALAAKPTVLQKIQLIVGNLLMPDLAVGNNLPIEFLSHDKQVVDDYKVDELVHDRITPRLAKFILDEGRNSIAKAKNWNIPTMLLVAGKDRLVDSNGAIQFFENSNKEFVKMQIYENLYHEIFNETHAEREKVYNDLKNWFLLQIAK